MLTLRFVLFTLALSSWLTWPPRKEDRKRRIRIYGQVHWKLIPILIQQHNLDQKRADDGAPVPIARSDRSSSEGSNDEEKAKRIKGRRQKQKGGKKHGKRVKNLNKTLEHGRLRACPK
uniref:Putative secreted protein n=1 Tax=Amblyomma triste TaxID=251400 RepID=A0A023G234_AMBTT